MKSYTNAGIFIMYKARALDKREYQIIIFLSSHRNHNVVTPHLNRLIETVQMRGHNICFYAVLTKIFPHYSPTSIKQAPKGQSKCVCLKQVLA